ncbi:MAG: hypothetical protein N0E58_15815 [Candidatus Thiodiazotropha endolucinida]|uniref:Uncharacterized protein n=1 Tax=Candidatus Thiodiazotropha taylori TaxID=2792791 RepID=A0A9E4NLV9_9GAMM|nr:hypothetical protein [Candidatus Thiodiazotropha taylori]MCW4237714.1 hypothetical protein [Candidatus Thiodiazotropha endolucinida]
MTEVDVISAIGVSVVTGGVSSMATIKALGVHITYIREKLAEHGDAIRRAHERADELEDEMNRCKITIMKLHPGEDL